MFLLTTIVPIVYRYIMTDTAEQLIAEALRIDDHIKAQSKAFTDYLAPFKQQREEIENKLLALLNSQNSESIKADSGTAYISTILTPKINNRDNYLDWINENWDDFGNEMLQLSAPQKEALKQYMEENNNALPPGVEISYFRRLNIRRS